MMSDTLRSLALPCLYGICDKTVTRYPTFHLLAFTYQSLTVLDS